MTMRNPAMAVLWECWRLSRFSLLTLMFCSMLAGAVLLIAFESGGETPALLVAAFVALLLTDYWTIRLRRGPGFPMTLGFSRPIPTWVLVSLPMAYVGASAAIAFLIPMIAHTAVFGLSFPLLPAAILIVTGRLALLASHWWTGRTAIGVVGWIIVYLLTVRQFLFSAASGSDFSAGHWAEMLTLSPATFGLMSLVAVGSVALTIFGVARQRRGDNGFGMRDHAATGAGATRVYGAVSRLSDLIRVRCPISSPTAAQLWYETRTGGARVVGRGILSVMGFTLVVLIAYPMGEESGGYFYATAVLIIGLFLPLIAGLRSLLGVRRAQGVTYLSPFNTTRPITTARLIGLKVTVTSFAILLSWVAIGTAFWVLPTDFMELGTKPDFDLGLLVTAPLDVAILVLIPLAYAVTLIASAGAVHAVFLRHPRPVVVGGQVFGIYLVAMIYLFATDRVTESAILVQVAVITAAGALVTLYLCRRTLRERIFGTRGLIAILALETGVAAGVVFFPERWGGLGGDLSPADIPPVALIVLLPLLASVLTPWSFARIRHR
jgi:hypothetical protein